MNSAVGLVLGVLIASAALFTAIMLVVSVETLQQVRDTEYRTECHTNQKIKRLVCLTKPIEGIGVERVRDQTKVRPPFKGIKV